MRLMKIISLAAVASGSAIEKRASTSVGITNFQADCTPHGSTCRYNLALSSPARQSLTNHYSYSFDINVDGNTAPIACSGTAPSDGVGVLPATSGSCSGDSAYTWFTARTTLSTDLFFDVQWTSPYTNDVVIFCHPIPQDQINTQNDGASTSQHYDGPTSFTADVNGCS